MLRNTFIHLPGINQKKEQKLWSEGILCWNDFLKCNEIDWIKDKKLIELKNWLLISKKKLENGDISYFAMRLKNSDLWRAFPEFRNKVAFLDIETTGLNKYKNLITSIALYGKNHIKYYIQGKNLIDFKNDIYDYSILVTYNGKTFDIPFIEHEFAITLPHPHIDLRWLLSSIGYQGGQKNCEKELGIDRGNVAEVDGCQAIALWNKYQQNPRTNKDDLVALVAYNIHDAVNLENLLILTYNRKIEKIPCCKINRLDKSQPPNITVSRIKMLLDKYELTVPG